jgi:hypothetical protein
MQKKKQLQSGLDDLPVEVALAIESKPPAPENAKPAETATQDSVLDLVERLKSIRERLFWLQAVWATTLSPDVALEADKYRKVFQDLGDQLKAKDRNAFDALIAGHEALLLAEPLPTKGTIPLETQRRFELLGELRARPSPQPVHQPDGYVCDGLQNYL